MNHMCVVVLGVTLNQTAIALARLWSINSHRLSSDISANQKSRRVATTSELVLECAMDMFLHPHLHGDNVVLRSVVGNSPNH